jgi:hypothetical protein
MVNVPPLSSTHEAIVRGVGLDASSEELAPDAP